MKFSEQELHASGAASPSGPRTSLIPDALLDLEVGGFSCVSWRCPRFFPKKTSFGKGTFGNPEGLNSCFFEMIFWDAPLNYKNKDNTDILLIYWKFLAAMCFDTFLLFVRMCLFEFV